MNEVTVKWVGEDIKAIYSDWSDDKCDEVLGEISKQLESRVIEVGNDALYYLLSDWVADNEEGNDE
mgnify:FL=1|jgi:hypothetical protein